MFRAISLSAVALSTSLLGGCASESGLGSQRVGMGFAHPQCLARPRPAGRAVLWMAIRDDKQFRKMAFMEIARQDKSLVDDLLRNGGIVTLEASEFEKQEVTNNTLEEDNACDDYDPSEDEYKD